MANPPFAAPDEADHYVRALGLAQGRLIGDEVPEADIGGTPRQRAWVAQLLRAVEVPDGLDPAPYNCVRGDARASAACQDAARPTGVTRALTDVGPYQPLPYVVAGLAARAGSTPPGADRAARVAGLVVILGLLALAAVLTERRALLGAGLAVTPMVLFLGASVTSSGFEIAAGLAFAAAVLRLARDPVAARHRAALAVTGALLALSRSPGPLWVVLLLALGAAVMGSRAAVRRAGAAALTTIGAAVVLNRVWEAAHGPSLTTDLHGGALEAVRQAWRAAPQLVGRFGYLEWSLPLWIPLVWGALVAALAVVALRRQRRLAAGVLAAAVVLPPLFWLVALRGTGFGLQGRHLLPVLVAVPLVLARTGVPERLERVAWPVIGVVELTAFWLNARRAATGVDGPLFFVGDAQWTPPGGWIPWLILAVAGALRVAGNGPPLHNRRVASGPSLGKQQGARS